MTTTTSQLSGSPVQLAAAIGSVLTGTTAAAQEKAEIRAITDAMIRLLAGAPLRSDGKLTIKSLAAEAGLRRNKLTHKHTGLRDLFYALVRAQAGRPAIADRLHHDNGALRAGSGERTVPPRRHRSPDCPGVPRHAELSRTFS
ncbi:hypothetical protein QQY66_01445 [Streptomyces sp. DG2A-72]|uniref:hypothetical protein n=1 Tax=Streptomyces sp. DG2A-72 TaxID=3051386 RepID=UPI00265B82E4|nr:hypothetical protein [Streptomyces sp. DG2A-72]MDO0930426.1 hypothetical protein [Streptomyces sp. DG2A-72]